EPETLNPSNRRRSRLPARSHGGRSRLRSDTGVAPSCGSRYRAAWSASAVGAMLALELVGGTWRIDGCGRRSRPSRKPRLLSVSGRTAAIRRKGNPRRLRGRMDHGDAMTDVPPKTRRMPPPENAVQWGILVFWAVVIVV